jgi:hypothetical protein
VVICKITKEMEGNANMDLKETGCEEGKVDLVLYHIRDSSVVL